MSLPTRVALVGLITLLMMAGAWKFYVEGLKAGRAEVRVEWDAERRTALASQLSSIQSQQQVVNRTMTKYVAKAAQERMVYRDLVREVEHYVPSDLVVLPGGFRVLHDAAATGSALPDAADTGGADAAAVRPEDLADTLIVNYEECRGDRARLRALQEVLQSSVSECTQR